MTRRITVRAIIYKDSHLFALKQIGSDGINDFWSTPGGGLEEGESLEQGLVREMIEETGIHPIVGSLLFVYQFQDRHDVENLEFFFHVTNAEDYEEIDLSATTHGQKEISEYGFKALGETHLLPEFLTQDNITTSIASGRTELISYL